MGREEGAADASRPRARTADASTEAASRQLPLLTSVAVVCRAKPAIDALDEVKQAIDGFADVSPLWAMRRACATNVPGLLRLLRCIAAHQGPNIDPFYKHSIFEGALGLATERNNIEAAHWLIDEYAPDSTIRHGAKAAACCGRVDLLEWFQANHSARVVWESKDLHAAAETDRFEAVRWLHDNASPAAFKEEKKILREAVKNGNVEMAEWVCRLHLPDPEPEDVARLTAERARVLSQPAAVPRWAFDREKPLIDEAILRGQVETAKWLLARGVGDSVSSSAPERAGDYGNFSAVEWAARHLAVEAKSAITNAVDQAAALGRVDAVQVLCLECEGTCTTKAMDKAAANGHLNTVKWLNENRSKGCGEEALNDAATAGHLEVVQYLHTVRGGTITERAILLAAVNGHAAVLKWLLRHYTGARIESDVMYKAVKHAGFEVLLALRDDGRCDVGFASFMEAISTRCYTIFHWLLAQGFLEVRDVMNDIVQGSLENSHLRECLDEFQRLL